MPLIPLPCGCVHYRVAFGLEFPEKDDLCNKHWIINEALSVLSIAGAEIKKEMEQEGGSDGG